MFLHLPGDEVRFHEPSGYRDPLMATQINTLVAQTPDFYGRGWFTFGTWVLFLRRNLEEFPQTILT
jgi:hypothetical protein